MSELAARFVPPHCPRTDCRYHRSRAGWRWTRHGSFRRASAPHRIPRFRCGHCGHTFSEQTFSTTYWLRRPDVLLAAGYRLLACSGYRQIAREARCAPTTVMRHAARLGRLGITPRPVPTREILRAWLFPQRVGLPEAWARYYRGEVPTRYLRNERRHALKLAA